MATWWASLSVLMKVLWAVTLSATLIFVIQTILTFLGIGDHSDVDTDIDGSMDFSGDGAFDADPSMNMLTFRNFVVFCLGFGWTSVLLKDNLGSGVMWILVSFAVGILFVVGVMYLYKWLNGMQQSGNIYIKTAVGAEGTAYLQIPGGRKGIGKVQISINSSIREYEALTDGETIKTGTPIKVIDVINDNTLLVESQRPDII